MVRLEQQQDGRHRKEHHEMRGVGRKTDNGRADGHDTVRDGSQGACQVTTQSAAEQENEDGGKAVG